MNHRMIDGCLPVGVCFSAALRLRGKRGFLDPFFFWNLTFVQFQKEAHSEMINMSPSSSVIFLFLFLVLIWMY